MKNGEMVAAFERQFAQYVGADYAIAHCNGTATLHTALMALGVKRNDRVAVPPLTMASTSIAVLHAHGSPVFVDIDPETWLMRPAGLTGLEIPVSLYGLHYRPDLWHAIDDGAQTLRSHGDVAFTSYSFQASKILALSEGGMLVTNNAELATKARTFASLGYAMEADKPKIDPAGLKRPDAIRHPTLGWNYRMSDIVAAEGLLQLDRAGQLIAERHVAAEGYRQAIEGCEWITSQKVPEGSGHDYWCYAVALDTAERWEPFVEAIERNGGERPYAAWRLTYHEPALAPLVPEGGCPVAEDLQPRLVQLQTNDMMSAERNAYAIRGAIRELGGTR